MIVTLSLCLTIAAMSLRSSFPDRNKQDWSSIFILVTKYAWCGVLPIPANLSQTGITITEMKWIIIFYQALFLGGSWGGFAELEFCFGGRDGKSFWNSFPLLESAWVFSRRREGNFLSLKMIEICGWFTRWTEVYLVVSWSSLHVVESEGISNTACLLAILALDPH